MRPGNLRELARGAVWLAFGAAVGCFTGDGLVDQPCRTDADCNAWADALGRRISCQDSVCGAFCGDGTIAGGEQCEDGNDDEDDACVACRTAVCGDGAVWKGHEECDDGNTATDDGCVRCRNAVCGDGEVWSGKEACDDGNDDPKDGCAGCETVVCGDGVVHPAAETCDDGNTEENDGCNAACSQGAERLSRGSSAWHTCAVRHGAIRCWGENISGELGYGHIAVVGDEESDFPLADVPIDGDVLEVAAGFDYTCARLDGGGDNVRCWGRRSDGTSIGDQPGERPVVAPVGGTATALATADSGTCVVLVGGTVRCWRPEQDPSQAGPVDLAGPAVDVAPAGTHACALLEGGVVQCWGNNLDGQFGDPTGVEYGTGAPVVLGAKATQVCAGYDHTCALLKDGAVRCWGPNFSGTLGTGNGFDIIGDDETPGSRDPVHLGGRAVRLACGRAHTCALRDDGALVCWGDGWLGQLGHDDVETIGDDERPGDVAPVILPEPVLDVIAGASYTCALSQGGVVRCWGENSVGQLGVGTTKNVGDDPGEMPPDPVRIYE